MEAAAAGLQGSSWGVAPPQLSPSGPMTARPTLSTGLFADTQPAAAPSIRDASYGQVYKTAMKRTFGPEVLTPEEAGSIKSQATIRRMERAMDLRRHGYRRLDVDDRKPLYPLMPVAAESKRDLQNTSIPIDEWKAEVKQVEAIYGGLEDAGETYAYVPGGPGSATATLKAKKATTRRRAGAATGKPARQTKRKQAIPKTGMFEDLRSRSSAALLKQSGGAVKRGKLPSIMSSTAAQELKLTSADSLDPSLPKEFRVADSTLRARRQAAAQAGRLNDFNPTFIGTGDPDAVKRAVDAEPIVGVDQLLWPSELDQRFQDFIGNDDKFDGLYTSEFRSKIARPLSASAYLSAPDLRMEAEGVGVALKHGGIASGQRLPTQMFSYDTAAHQAATLIQRARLGYVAHRKRVAQMVQWAFRGWKTRQKFKAFRVTSLTAIVKMQAVLRGRKDRNLFRDMQESHRQKCATLIQSIWRGIWGRQRAAHHRALRNHRAAEWIQSVARGWRDRARCKNIRLHLTMGAFERVLRCTLLLQRVARGMLGRVLARPVWHRRFHAINIQRVWRGFVARKELLNWHATRIQRLYRGWTERRWVEELKLERAEEGADRQIREDDAVERAGKTAVKKTLAFLQTPEGKRKLKYEKGMVKRWMKANKKARKAMSKAERVLEDVREVFEMYDLDGSGSIDLDELRLMVNELCIPMDDDELRSMFERLDASGDGNIDYREFVGWYTDSAVITKPPEPEPEAEAEGEPDAAYLDAEPTHAFGKGLSKLFSKVKPSPAGPGRPRPKIPKKKQVAPETLLMVTTEETKAEREAWEKEQEDARERKKKPPPATRPLDMSKHWDPANPLSPIAGEFPVEAGEEETKAEPEVVPPPGAVLSPTGTTGPKGGYVEISDDSGSEGEEDGGDAGDGGGDFAAGDDFGEGGGPGAGEDLDDGGDFDDDEEDDGEYGDDEGEYDEDAGDVVNLNSPEMFFRRDSAEDLLDRKMPKMLSPPQYRRAKGIDSSKKGAADDANKGRNVKKAGFNMGLVRTKLRAKKLVRSVLGRNVTTWARRNIVALARLKARIKTRESFRKDNPPYWTCPNCVCTFGLYRPFRRHFIYECLKTGDNELHPRLKRA